MGNVREGDSTYTRMEGGRYYIHTYIGKEKLYTPIYISLDRRYRCLSWMVRENETEYREKETVYTHVCREGDIIYTHYLHTYDSGRRYYVHTHMS